MKVKVVNESNNPLPEYTNIGDAGMDLRANLTEPVTIDPLKRKLIPTGLHIQMQQDGHYYEGQIRPRSGLALKYGISVCNTPGTIDAKYSGEIGVVLINLGEEPFTVNPGDRIAQIVFNEVEKAELIEVDSFQTEDDRGGGFGHSGIK